MFLKLYENMQIAKSLLRVPTYLLLLMYLVIGFLTAVCTVVAKGTVFDFEKLQFVQLLGCALVIACWYICGCGLNDYADYEIDKINLKNDRDRPLVIGLTTKNKLLRVVLYVTLIGLLAASLLSLRHLALLFVLLLLNVAYSIKPLQLSRRGGLGILLMPSGYIILPFLSGFYLVKGAHFESLAWGLLLAYCLHFIGRIILKDYRDVVGDKKFGKKTFLLRHSNQTVAFVSMTTTIASSALVLVTLSSVQNPHRLAIIFLCAMAVINLQQLTQQSKWQLQKPILASFGRVMTGITALTIFALVGYIWNLSVVLQFNLGLVLAAVYTVSARQAATYNADRLRK